MKRTLIVGGANGIGLSIAVLLSERECCESIYIVDKVELKEEYNRNKITAYKFDLLSDDYSFFDKFKDIDSLIITAGFGKLSLFKDIEEQYIIDSFNLNTVATIRIIKHFYNRLLSDKNFYCGVMVSIAGFMSSPFFSIYGATKASLRIFIESVNVELLKAGTTNQILNVSPGSIRGTNFYKGRTDIGLTKVLSEEIISNVEDKNDLFIPEYEEIYKTVLKRYHDDFRKEGMHSYDYKLKTINER